jgi:hypothetical protein
VAEIVLRMVNPYIFPQPHWQKLSEMVHRCYELAATVKETNRTKGISPVFTLLSGL